MLYHKIQLSLAFLTFLLPGAMKVAGQTVFRVNQYNVIYDGGWMPIFTLSSQYSFNEKVAFNAYFYINGSASNSWGEGLAGLAWTPAKGIALAFLGGFQTNDDQLWRISPVFNVSGNKFSAFGSIEYGGARHRWDLMTFYHMGRFKLGGELIRYYKMFAAGPRVEFTFMKKQPLTLFYSGLYDWKGHKPASMFGLYTSFGHLRSN